MSKVSSYLQSHIVGEVLTRSDICDAYSRDGSVLQQKPDMVVHPRTVNDIRKIVRFSSQLAAKGHKLSILARGCGTSVTASSVSGGIVIDMASHLSGVLEYDTKQRLVRTQSGVNLDTLVNALRLHGTTMPQMEPRGTGTVGGYIGEGYGANLEANYEHVRSSIARLEIVLSGGELLQTGPISKRELGKKKGLPGAEGDMYRGIDTVLEDYAEVIDTLRGEPYRDMSGYPGIADVVGKGGTFDLTPLFVGAQGTLGIVAEAILKTDFRPAHVSYGVAVFSDGDTARDALDILRKASPSFLEFMDASILETARTQQSEFDWYEAAGKKLKKISHVVVFGWQAFGERKTDKSIKKTTKALQKLECFLHIPRDDEEIEKLDSLRDIANYLKRSTTNIADGAPEVVSGFYIPGDNFETFSKELKVLAKTLQLDLPLYGSALSSIYTVLPQLSLKKVGDKQKIFKLIDLLMKLVDKHNGTYYARGGEGKLTTHYARENWDDKKREMVAAIRAVFDPHGILNSGVKQEQAISELIPMLRADNTVAPHLSHSPSA